MSETTDTTDTTAAAREQEEAARRRAARDDRKVDGYCPMGCGRTLFLADGGNVTCSLIGCPRPTAASDLLDDAETEHVVTLRPDDFIVRHPLRERLEQQLEDCALHAAIAAFNGPPHLPGRYRVTRLAPDSDHWRWRRLEEEAER